jgi:branched-chain amino acid aminotransferase
MEVPGYEESDVGSADLNWMDLGFEYRPTNTFAKVEYKDGAWGPVELISGEPYVKVHIAATALHYGQACFEGLKAFQCKDGKVRLFRPDENAMRIAKSCVRVCMPPPPMDKFMEACKMAVHDNLAYVPPYGSGGALYIRPVLFGSGPRIGLQPADEYTMLIITIPVGDYYKGGLKPVPAFVIDDYDRAAPRGVGNVKVAGNYAADMLPNQLTKKKGYPIGLYLDAKVVLFFRFLATEN